MMYRITMPIGCLVLAASSLTAQEKAKEAPKVNYTDHVQPIFREHCLKCHNANDAKGGLAIDSYAALMEGGGSGEIVYEGDAEGSRLYQLMVHEDTPVMPPNQDPIAAEKIAVIKNWINGGLLENSGSKARKKKGPSLSYTPTAAGQKPEVVAMPESVWRVPVVTSSRAAAASALATSPWAPLVAVGGQKQVSLYNTDTAELAGVIPYPEGIPQVLQFNSDGSYLLVAGGKHASQGVAALYDVKNGNRVLTVGDELDTVFGADINETLTRVALGGPQKMVRIFDTSTGEALFELKKHTDWVYTVDYSPDGVLVASGDRAGGLHVWEGDTGRLYLDLIGHKAAVRSIAWRADSNVLVSGSEDGTIKLWEMSAGKQLKSFNAHGGGVTGVMLAKDGRIVSCGKDGTVKLWKADGAAIATFPSFGEPALEAVITHDGSKVIGGDWNGKTIMWAAADVKQATQLAANPPSLVDQKASVAAKVTELQTAFSNATTAYTNQQSALEANKKSHEAMVAKVASTRQLIAKSTADKTAAEKLMVEMKNQKAAADKKLAEAKNKVAQLGKTVQDATQQKQVFAKQVADATSRRDATAKTKAGLVAQITKLQGQRDSIQKESIALLTAVATKEMGAAAEELLGTKQESAAEAARKAAEGKTNELNQLLAQNGEALKGFNEKLSTAKAEQKRLGDTLAPIQNDLASAQKAIDAKNAEIAGVQKQIAESKDDSQKAELTKKITQYQTELTSAAGVKAAVEKKLSELKEKQKQQDAAVNALVAQATEVTKKVTELTPQRDASQNQLKQATSQRDAAAKRKSAATAKRAEIAKERVAADQAKSNAVNQISELIRQLESAQVQVQTQTAAFNKEEAARAAAATKVAELTAALDAQSKSLAAAKVEEQTANAAVVELGKKVASQPAVIAKIAQQIKQNTAAMPSLEKQVVDLKGNVDKAVQAVATAKSTVDSTQGQVDQAKQALAGIETELVAFNSQAAKLAAAQKEAEAVAEQKRKAAEPEAAKAVKVESSVTARQTELDQLQATLAKLQSQMAEMQKAQSAEKQSLDTIKAKLQELQSAAEAAEADAEAKREKAEFFNSAYGA